MPFRVERRHAPAAALSRLARSRHDQQAVEGRSAPELTFGPFLEGYSAAGELDGRPCGAAWALPRRSIGGPWPFGGGERQNANLG